MKLFAFILRRSRGPLLLAMLAGLVSGAASSAFISVINTALLEGAFGTTQALLSFFGLLILALGSRLGMQLLLNRLNQGAIFELRMQLCRRILAATLRQFEELGTHRLTALLSEDIPTVSNSLMMLPTVAINAATLVGCLVYLGMLSPGILLSLCIFIVVGTLIYRLPVKLGMRYLLEAREKSDTFHKAFRGLMEGIKELKLHQPRRTAFVSQGVEVAAMDLQRLSLASTNILGISSTWGMFLFLSFLGLLFFGVTRVIEVSAATMTSCTLTLLYLQRPIEVLMGSIPGLTWGNAALGRLQQFAPEDREAHPDGAVLPAPAPRFEQLELRGLTHTYFREQDDSPFRLGPIHLTLRRGELVFLVGGNGSGKTTLAKLITGLYAPEGGELRLNGEPVTEANRERYRQLFSAVFSDFHVFDTLFGLNPSGRKAQVEGYLSRLQLGHKVRISEDGVLSTTNLSQGQRKRLALLTAYLEDRPFYLFDEWASDQDPVFKEIFYSQLLPDLRAQGKTVLVISHDNRYFHVADRLILLESGRLVDAPAPLELDPLAARRQTAS
ncbi:MAG TPA: cyclic peptide export ABC transporter [Myxococcus sp.]|nr:cyclic peptide export ABC transporter [Myxococcus sp.]